MLKTNNNLGKRKSQGGFITQTEEKRRREYRDSEEVAAFNDTDTNDEEAKHEDPQNITQKNAHLKKV